MYPLHLKASVPLEQCSKPAVIRLYLNILKGILMMSQFTTPNKPQ